ncbi:MAG: radical SAM family heme chaperone HemW [Bacteroidales bacterium]|nr:radical SAM family heme chaperone HemW [Bacteroidales bacterium]
MRGIYIHIPFCRKACRYCDFYFSISLHYLDNFVDALVKEIRLKGEKNGGRNLETLYLGGGTPSLLSAPQLEKILKAIHSYHTFQEKPEWTIECNPDDLDVTTIKKLRQLGFNRLSIGVQSFHERDLEIMRRSHTAEQAEASVRQASSEGFDNITMDLIYGIPGQSSAEWEENIEKALSLPVSHLSAYHLTFEPGTVFDHWRKKGKLLPVPEEESVEQYRILREKLLSAGFDHYELSNFGRKGIVSKHNMLYWSGQSYLGLGPSAHSYDGERRSWNISTLKKYMDRISTGEDIGETEHLTSKELYHDYLITSLRTKWGADPAHIEEVFGPGFRLHFEKQAQAFLEKGSMSVMAGRLVIEPGHWLITDHILRALFMD